MVFLSDALLGPFDWNVVVSSEGLNPVDVVVGSLPQDFLGDRADLMNVSEKVDDVLRAGEQREIPEDDDAIETVVYKNNEVGEQLRERFHRSSLVFLRTKMVERRTAGIKLI